MTDARAEPAAEPEPTHEQLQFARSVFIVLQLWPALRQAVLEEWGGPESVEKRDFLLSHLCDEYGNGGASTKPDMEDLIELIEGYVMEEFDCHLEDESVNLVAAHICDAHQRIFEEEKGDELLESLEKAYARVAGKKAVPTTSAINYEDGGDEDGDDEDTAQGEQERPVQRPRAEKMEPQIDEDGFETVVSRRRR